MVVKADVHGDNGEWDFDGMLREDAEVLRDELSALRCPIHGSAPPVEVIEDDEGLMVGVGDCCCEELERLVDEVLGDEEGEEDSDG